MDGWVNGSSRVLVLQSQFFIWCFLKVKTFQQQNKKNADDDNNDNDEKSTIMTMIFKHYYEFLYIRNFVAYFKVTKNDNVNVDPHQT